MNDNATAIETLFERAEDYSKTTLELLKLKAIDKTADAASSIVSSLVVFTTAALSLLIINIGVALWIGNLLGDSYLGFFTVGAFYAILSFPLYIFRNKWIKYPLSNTIIKQLLKQK